MAVSVVIPALDEADRIETTIAAAFAAGASEVIVSDGGSNDATVALARRSGAKIVETERIRARQLNAGAAAAEHDTLVFLHADTLLPPDAAEAVERALAGGAVFGGFRLEFLEPPARLAFVAFMINARTRMTHAPWGDQAQFVRRDTFLRIGGYAEIPIMEDYELARRMKRVGRIATLPLSVRTSGRRFLEKGVFRTSIINWLVITGWHLGVAPARLAKWYRGRKKT